jgi:hypothetical protein
MGEKWRLTRSENFGGYFGFAVLRELKLRVKILALSPSLVGILSEEPETVYYP